MLDLYDDMIKKNYTTCKRLENIVSGILDKLENTRYQEQAPMSKQLSLAHKATVILGNISLLSQGLKSAGADESLKEEKKEDPRIPGLLEAIKNIKEGIF